MRPWRKGLCGAARPIGAAVLPLAAAAVMWSAAAAVPGAIAAAAATLTGVIAEPDGSGARIQVGLSGDVHYMITPFADRIVITLDGVAAEGAAYRLSVGPVTGLVIRPSGGSRPRVDLVVTTLSPLDAAESSIEDHALVVRLAPRQTAAGSPALPAPVTSAGSSTGVLAGRIIIPRAIRLETGAGQLLQIDGLVRVAVSDPEILGTVPVSSRELLVAGRAAGRTTMYVWEGAGRLLAYTVEVAPAADRLAGLRQLLSALFPNAAIQVTEAPPTGAGVTNQRKTLGYDTVPAPAAWRDPSGGTPVPPHPSVPNPATMNPITVNAAAGPAEPSPAAGSALVLSGAVDTQIDRQKAEAVAHAYAPVIVDLLTVRRPIQLKLQVEVAEMSRNALHTLGITWGGGQQSPGAFPSLNGGVYDLQIITSPGVGTNGLDLLVAQIQALMQQGLARLLAEPRLVVLAGQSASLLLGGQVPIPIVGPNGAVTVEYKDFGVILHAHPDYQEDGRVFMQITPEVSTLDFADAIKVNGFVIPTLRVRRAQTVVSMLPTQTLVLGGLLQHQDTELLQKIPILGDLPVIGALFQSRTFQHQESDLVIFVTPVLIEPGGPPPLNP